MEGSSFSSKRERRLIELYGDNLLRRKLLPNAPGTFKFSTRSLGKCLQQSGSQCLRIPSPGHAVESQPIETLTLVLTVEWNHKRTVMWNDPGDSRSAFASCSNSTELHFDSYTHSRDSGGCCAEHKYRSFPGWRRAREPAFRFRIADIRGVPGLWFVCSWCLCRTRVLTSLTGPF